MLATSDDIPPVRTITPRQIETTSAEMMSFLSLPSEEEMREENSSTVPVPYDAPPPYSQVTSCEDSMDEPPPPYPGFII